MLRLLEQCSRIRSIKTMVLSSIIEYLKSSRPSKQVLVIGDVILDRYFLGEASRISPESPTPIVNFHNEEFRLGGAANTAHNLSALGANVILLGVVGNDDEAGMVRREVVSAGLRGCFLVDNERPTTTKLRVIAQGQQIVRIDTEMTQRLAESCEKELLADFDSRVEYADVVVVSDYAKGVVSDFVSKSIVSRCTELEIPVVVDPKGSDFSKYQGATIITPNLKEAVAAVRGLNRKEESDFHAIGAGLLKMLPGTAIAITLGSDGVLLFQSEQVSKFPTAARNVFDVTGAGDSVVAGIALGLAHGFNFCDTIVLANQVAGLAVEKRGTATVSLEELAISIGNAKTIGCGDS